MCKIAHKGHQKPSFLRLHPAAWQECNISISRCLRSNVAKTFCESRWVVGASSSTMISDVDWRQGEAYDVRFADDFILCFQYREDAEKVLDVLKKKKRIRYAVPVCSLVNRREAAAVLNVGAR
jgi:hypothetical protein